MATFPGANRSAQWFGSKFPGAKLTLVPATMVVVVHTTEGFDWPGYGGGATAPNYTGKPNIAKKSLAWRAHFEDDRSSRALRNLSGGVETNTLNAVQIELVGTCDYSKRHTWNGRKAGVDYIYWPDAPDWALRELAKLLAYFHNRYGLRLQSPVKGWLNYGPDNRRPGVTPASYGASPVRLTGAQWRQTTGVVGHQHVPENTHGDPGALDIAKVLAFAKGDAPGKGNDTVSKKPTRVSRFKADGPPRYNMARLDKAVSKGKRTGRVKEVRDAIDAQIARLPHDRNPKSRVHKVIESYTHDRILRMGALNNAVSKGGRKGVVKEVRDEIRRLIKSLPAR